MPTDSAPTASSAATEPPGVLFVCRANVCRSPTMLFLTADRFAKAGVSPYWPLRSAGSDAHPGAPMCNISAATIASRPGGTKFSREQRAHRLDFDDLAEAGLVLVASQRERSAITTRVDAAFRERTFTMIEAALLLHRAVEDGARLEEGVGADALADLLHQFRGRSGQAARRLQGIRRVRDPVMPELDIPDPHAGPRTRHIGAIRDLRWASKQLAVGVRHVLS